MRKVAPVLIRDMDALMRERTVFVIIKIRVRFFLKYKYVPVGYRLLRLHFTNNNNTMELVL
mgnify:FL=1